MVDLSFDGPGRAIRCVVSIGKAVRSLGVEVRTGPHTGEVELSKYDASRVAVYIASRVAALAGPGGTLVPRLVKDPVTGSVIEFEELGIHELKGIPEDWQLLRAVS